MICPKNYHPCNVEVRYNPRKLFVIMPFREFQAPQSLFDQIQSGMVGWQVEKANTDTRKPEVWCNICSNIQESRAVIADLSGPNPNVMMELGMIFGLARPFVLLTQDYNDLTFDTQGFQVFKYSRSVSNPSRVDNPGALVETIKKTLRDAPELTPEMFRASREGHLYQRILAAKKTTSGFWKKQKGKWRVKDIGDSVDKCVVCLLDSHPTPKSTSTISSEVGLSQRQARRIMKGKSGTLPNYFIESGGGYLLSDEGINWALDEILPDLPR